MAAGAMKVVSPNRFVRYDLIRCIALASFVHTPSGLSTAVWPETYHFETEPQLAAIVAPDRTDWQPLLAKIELYRKGLVRTCHAAGRAAVRGS